MLCSGLAALVGGAGLVAVIVVVRMVLPRTVGLEEPLRPVLAAWTLGFAGLVLGAYWGWAAWRGDGPCTTRGLSVQCASGLLAATPGLAWTWLAARFAWTRSATETYPRLDALSVTAVALAAPAIVGVIAGIALVLLRVRLRALEPAPASARRAWRRRAIAACSAAALVGVSLAVCSRDDAPTFPARSDPAACVAAMDEGVEMDAAELWLAEQGEAAVLAYLSRLDHGPTCGPCVAVLARGVLAMTRRLASGFACAVVMTPPRDEAEQRLVRSIGEIGPAARGAAPAVLRWRVRGGDTTTALMCVGRMGRGALEDTLAAFDGGQLNAADLRGLVAWWANEPKGGRWSGGLGGRLGPQVFDGDPAELRYGCTMVLNVEEEEWHELMRSGRFRVAAEAARVLWTGRSRRYAREVLQAATNRRRTSAEWDAVASLVDASLDPPNVIGEIERADPEWGLWLAGLRPNPSVVPTILARHEQSPSPETILALGASKNARALPPLVAMLQHGHGTWTKFVVRALGDIDQPEVEAALLARAESLGGWAQADVCVVLGRLGTAASLPYLRRTAARPHDGGALSIWRCAHKALKRVEARLREARTPR